MRLLNLNAFDGSITLEACHESGIANGTPVLDSFSDFRIDHRIH
jgi:hypothetical protein